MTDTKISGLAALAGTALATTDEFVVVDKSDTTMAASGTDKKITTDGIFTRPAAQVRRAANQSIGDATDVYLSFDAEDFDNASIWTVSPNPTRLTVPVAGLYHVTTHIAYASATNGYLAWRINGTGAAFAWCGAGQTDNVGNTILLKLAANDYVESMAWQDSAGALNATARTTIAYVGTG